MVNTAGQLRELLDMFKDDEPLIFVAVHPDDKKYLARSADNQVCVILSKPTVDLSAICVGRMAKTDKPNPRVVTIFLTGK